MEYVEGEVVVIFSDSVEGKNVTRILEEVGTTLKKVWSPWKRGGLRAIASVPPGEETPWAKKISEHPQVIETQFSTVPVAGDQKTNRI